MYLTSPIDELVYIIGGRFIITHAILWTIYLYFLYLSLCLTTHTAVTGQNVYNMLPIVCKQGDIF